MNKTKPNLFLDVDGVFLAKYGNPSAYQLRPYAGSFLAWASKHFNCYWLTCHGKDSTAKICELSNIVQINFKDPLPPVGIPFISYLPWRDYNKESEDYTGINLDKLQGVADVCGLKGDWIVIEDNYPCYDGYKAVMADSYLKERWVIVDSEGENCFVELIAMLNEFLASGKINPSFVQPKVDALVVKEGLSILKKINY